MSLGSSVCGPGRSLPPLDVIASSTSDGGASGPCPLGAPKLNRRRSRIRRRSCFWGRQSSRDRRVTREDRSRADRGHTQDLLGVDCYAHQRRRSWTARPPLLWYAYRSVFVERLQDDVADGSVGCFEHFEASTSEANLVAVCQIVGEVLREGRTSKVVAELAIE